MRLAIPVWNDRVSPVFDAARRLVLVDIEGGVERGRREEALPESFLAQRAKRLSELGVSVLICGGISRPLLTLLADSGLSVCPWTAGLVEEVVHAYLAGQLHKPEWRMPGCGGRQQCRRGGRRGARKETSTPHQHDGRHTVKIAAITDDGKTLSRHFGRAQYFLVVTVEDGRVAGQELRAKAGHHTFAPHEPTIHDPVAPHGSDPASRGRHAQMLTTIRDCEAVLAGGMGQGMLLNLQQAGIRPVLTEIKDIQEAIRSFVEGKLVDRPERVH